MGHTTDFVGHIDIDPPLNPAEVAYLEAFRHTRHDATAASPYDVRGNPLAPEVHDRSEATNTVGHHKPQLWCQWQVCSSGCCLAFDGMEKFYAPVEWMQWLISHLLAPGAAAADVAHPLLQDFTFDHHLHGIVVGCRRDTRELFAISVADNEVVTTVLRRGDPQPWESLGYQDAIDRDRAARDRRRADSPAASLERLATRAR